MKLSVNFQECDDSMGFNFEEKTESFNIGFGDNYNGSSIDNEKVNAIEKKVDSLEEKVLEVDESVKTAITKAENAEKTANESKFTTDNTLTLKDGILSVNTDVVGGGGGGGVTSWNDLKDKPFYEESEIAELVSNLTTEAYNNGQFPPCNFIVGEKYNVIWNGESYNDLICYELDGYRVIGGEGYPFYFDDDGGNSLYIESTTDETDFVVTIIGKRVTIKTIDEKFLPSWDDLKNKPFGEIPPAFDITWDGNMEGHEVVDDGAGGYAVKVSDQVFTKEQLLNSTTFYSNSYEVINTEENISVDEEMGAIYLDGVIVLFSAENFNSAAGLPEGTFSNGVWFNNWTGEDPYYVNRLVAATTIKKIDKEYLPDTEVSWNDLTDKPFGEEIQYNLVVTSGATTTSNVTVSFTAVVGKTYKIEAIDVGSNTILASAIKPCTALNFGTFTQYTISDPKIYGTSYDNSSWSFQAYVQVGQSTIFKIYEESVSFITIDEKYIPDTIATKQYVDEAIANTDKEVSWKNITDKPFEDKIDFSTEIYRSMGKFVFTAISDGQYNAHSSGILVNLISGKRYQLTVSYMGTSTYAIVEGVASYDSLLKQFIVVGNGGEFRYDGSTMSILCKSDNPDLANPNFASMMVVVIKEGNDVVIPLDKKYLPDVVVLESELDAKGYQNEEQVKALINNALEEIENGTY